MFKPIVSSMKFVIFVFLFVRTSLTYKVPYTKLTRTIQSRTLVSQDSNLAIDGYRHTCSMVAGENKTEHAWWRVIFEQTFLIHKIMIFFRSKEAIAPGYKRYLSAYISSNESNPEESWCKPDPNYGTIQKDDALVILCNQPIFGSIITLKKHGTLIHSMMLCEVNVFVSGLIKMSNIRFAAQSAVNGVDRKSAVLAVDGLKNTCTRIYTVENPAWWLIELADKFYIHRIIIDFNQNTSVTQFQKYLKVFVSKDAENIHKEKLCADIGERTKFNKQRTFIDELCVDPNPLGKFVTIRKYGGSKPNAMMFCEVTVIANISIVDGADNSMAKTACKNNEIFCRVFSDFLCIPKLKLCNKVKDCPNGIDEINCTCQKDNFKCKDGQCIPKEWLCDDLRDCQLGEDEEQNCAAHCKREDDFVCERTKQCINRVKRCNGYMECSDHSDEHGCFEMVVQGVAEEKYLLLATYHGEHEYYVCADNWNQQMSYDMCQYLTGRTLGGYYEYKPKWIKEELVIISREKNPFENSIPSMANFRETNNCTALVEILCQWKPSVVTRYLCGTRAIPDEELGPYIINGDAAKLGAWPWQVQILAQGNQMCGGSILNERWILTAAHCSRNMEESDLIVKVGTNKFDDPDVEGIGVSLIVNHPSYEGVKNDIGLLRLSKQIKFSKTVTPICLPKKKYELDNLKYFRYCVMAGFGRIDRAHSHPLYLMQGRMNLMPDDVCVKNLATIGEDTEQGYMKALKENYLLCAGSVPTRYGINPCWGDSGGPLVCKDGFGIWYQVAMVELFEIGRYKEECTNSLLTKVDYHLDFISKALQSDMAKVFQTYIGISSYLIISLKYLSVSQNVFLCQ